MPMETIPVIASLDDLDSAVAAAAENVDARWYVMRRAVQLGADDKIPSDWLEGMVAAFKGNRDKAAEKGEALQDGSFPIPDVGHLKRAIQAYGRAKDKPRAKSHIIKRAKALNAVDVLPDAWKSGIAASAVVASVAPDEQPAFTHNDTSWSVTEALLAYCGGDGEIEDLTSVINDCALVAAGDESHLHDFEHNTLALIASFANSGRIDTGEREELEEALVAAVRHVRTPEGVKFYGQPIGSVIVPNTYLPVGSKKVTDLREGDFIVAPSAGNAKVRVKRVTTGSSNVIVEFDRDGGNGKEVTSGSEIFTPNRQVQIYRSAPKGAKASLASLAEGSVAKHSDPWYVSSKGGYTQNPELAVKNPDGSPKSEVDNYKKREPSFYEREINNDGESDAAIAKYFADAGLTAKKASDATPSSHSDPVWRISGPKDKLTAFARENGDEDAEIKSLSSLKTDDSVPVDTSGPKPEAWDKRGNKIAVGDTVEGKRVSKVSGRDLTFDDGSTAVSTSVRKDTGPDSARVFQTSHSVGSRSVATDDSVPADTSGPKLSDDHRKFLLAQGLDPDEQGDSDVDEIYTPSTRPLSASESNELVYLRNMGSRDAGQTNRMYELERHDPSRRPQTPGEIGRHDKSGRGVVPSTAGEQKLPGTGADHVSQAGDVVKTDTGAVGKTDKKPDAPKPPLPPVAQNAEARKKLVSEGWMLTDTGVAYDESRGWSRADALSESNRRGDLLREKVSFNGGKSYAVPGTSGPNGERLEVTDSPDPVAQYGKGGKKTGTAPRPAGWYVTTSAGIVMSGPHATRDDSVAAARTAPKGSYVDTDSVRPTLPRRAVKKVATPSAASSPSPASGFVTGRSKSLGTVDHSAKGSNPERFVPKTTMPDGVTPKTGMNVSYKKDPNSNGQIVETYQLAAAVRFPNGSVKTVSYSQLNSADEPAVPPASAPAPVSTAAPASSPSAKVTKTKVPAIDISSFSSSVKSLAKDAVEIRQNGQHIGTVQRGVDGSYEMQGRVRTGRFMIDKRGWLAITPDHRVIRKSGGYHVYDTQQEAIDALAGSQVTLERDLKKS